MYIGIDFGTSFSQAATMNMGEPILLMPNGVYGVPSDFYYDRETGVLIGTEADDEGQGKNVVNLKREIKMNLKSCFTADGYTFTSEDITSAIYRYVALLAQRVAKQKYVAGAERIEGAVISAPANFTIQEIDLLKRACMRPVECGGAGVPVLAVLKEPVAAALAYFRTPGEQNKNVLVFDLGGGTCDVALLKADCTKKEHYTVADSDMIRVGGCRWDDALTEYIVCELEKQTMSGIRSNPAYMEKIRNAAVDTKHSLSEMQMKNARIEIEGVVYKVTVSRVDFERMTQALLDESIGLLRRVYARNLRDCPVTDVICVGGSSLMPQVSEGIKRALPLCKVSVFSPETAVTFGTAIYADMILKGAAYGALGITDIATYSYGIRVYDDFERDPNYEVVSNLIVKGAQLPTFGMRTFSTIKKGGGDIVIRVYENVVQDKICELGEAPKEAVGKLVLILPPETPANYSVHVNMQLTEDRMLAVEAFDDGGNSVQASFRLNRI